MLVLLLHRRPQAGVVAAVPLLMHLLELGGGRSGALVLGRLPAVPLVQVQRVGVVQQDAAVLDVVVAAAAVTVVVDVVDDAARAVQVVVVVGEAGGRALGLEGEEEKEGVKL